MTILRNSPLLKIVANSVHHFKGCSVSVGIESIVESQVSFSIGSSNVHSSPVKVESRPPRIVFGSKGSSGSRTVVSHAHVVDLSTTDEEDSVGAITPSPSPKKKKAFRRSPSIPFTPLDVKPAVPTILDEFPPVSATEMDERLQWINDNEAVGSLAKRFSTVFSCTYKSSTFHRHWAAWQWLRCNGELSDITSDSPWKSLMEKVPRKSVASPISKDVEFVSVSIS